MSDTSDSSPEARRLRRALRHVCLACASGAFVVGLAPFLKGNHPGRIFGYSVASAHASFAWLAITLLIGPSRALRGRSTPRQLDLRRDVGIWAALLAFVHTFFGLQGHMQGRFWEYFVVRGASGWGPRRDLFGLANDLGLASLGIALLLLGLSNDWALRRLGGRLWKRAQRCSYGLFAVVLAHGVIFQRMGKRAWPLVGGLLTTAALVVVGQLLGVWTHRRKLDSSRKG